MRDGDKGKKKEGKRKGKGVVSRKKEGEWEVRGEGADERRIKRETEEGGDEKGRVG